MTCSSRQASSDELPQKTDVLIRMSAGHLAYYGDRQIIEGRDGVAVTLSNGVTVQGDVCSINLSLRRILVAGHVQLHTTAGEYSGAAFADFLPFRRAYFIPLAQDQEPDRWTFLNDDYAHPEKGREMPGDAFFLPDLSADQPFITARHAVLDPDNYVEFNPATFVFLNGGLRTPPAPVYVRNFSDNPNFDVNSLSGATYDIPFGFGGSKNSLETLHFRYDQLRKTYGAFEHHSVFGQFGYVVFSLNPATQPDKQWNLLSYATAGANNALDLNAQVFTYQYGLSQPLSSSGFADLKLTRALRGSFLRLETTEVYDSFLAPPALGYYGSPAHPFVPNHPFVAGLMWSGYDHGIGRSNITLRLLSGLGEYHDAFGVAGTKLSDVQTSYIGALISTPVYPGPFGTGVNASYQIQHVWMTFPNTADLQTASVTDSKRLSAKFWLTGSFLAQDVNTKNPSEIFASPNGSVGLVQQPLSPNGLPLLAGALTIAPHTTNQAFIFTASSAPSPNLQLNLSAQRNVYGPVQVPFVSGPAPWQAAADLRTRLSRTLFIDVGRVYYFNWGNQRWSPRFSLQVSAQ